MWVIPNSEVQLVAASWLYTLTNFPAFPPTSNHHQNPSEGASILLPKSCNLHCVGSLSGRRQEMYVHRLCHCQTCLETSFAESGRWNSPPLVNSDPFLIWCQQLELVQARVARENTLEMCSFRDSSFPTCFEFGSSDTILKDDTKVKENLANNETNINKVLTQVTTSKKKEREIPTEKIESSGNNGYKEISNSTGCTSRRTIEVQQNLGMQGNLCWQSPEEGYYGAKQIPQEIWNSDVSRIHLHLKTNNRSAKQFLGCGGGGFGCLPISWIGIL